MFEESDYDDERFAGLVADGVVVTGVRFAGCRFETSSFQEAVFRSCLFDDCSFSECNLSLVTVVESRFGGTAFTDCKATGVDWSDADWSSMSVVEPLSFSVCRLDHCVFMGLKLDRVLFTDCSVCHVDFSGASLREADFSGSDLTGARFSRTDLRRARLERAHSYCIDTNDNVVAGMRVALPEAVSLLTSTGVELVELPL